MHELDTRRILVIDDNQDFCCAVADLLSPLGYTVLSANDGAEGLSLACSGPDFAAVLVDLVMPGIDGLAVITELAIEKPDLPIVVVSGSNDLDSAVRAMREGAWAYLRKPILADDEILTTLRSVQERAERITGRARAEEALRASEERYRRIFQTVAASILMVDQQGRVIDINPFHLANFGGGRTRREDYLGRSVDSYSRVANAGLPEAYARVLDGETFEMNEVHFPPTDQSSGGYFNVRGVPLWDKDRVTGAVFVHEEITSRIKAEQALEYKLADQAALFDASRALLGQFSMATALTTICRLAVERFGMTMAWVGIVSEGTKRVRRAASHGVETDFLADIDIRWDDSPAGQGPTGTAIRTGKAVPMNRIVTDPACRRWRAAALERGFQSSAALPLLDGAKVLGALNLYSGEPEFFAEDRIQLLQSFANLAAVALRSARLYEQDQMRLASLEEHVSARTAQLTDAIFQLQGEVTERLEAEAALINSEERYRRLVENNPFGIAVHCDGKLVYANATAVRLLGASTPDQLVGKPAIQFLHPDYHEIAHERVASVIEKRGNASPLIVKYLRLDGKSIEVEASASFATHNNKPAVQSVFLDMSHRDDRSRRYTQRLQILREIYRAILAAESPEAIARAVLGHIRQLVAFRWASVTLFDFEAEMTIRRIAFVSDTDRPRSEHEKQIPPEEFRGLDILRQQKDFIVDDVRAVLNPSPGERKMLKRGIQSYANVPLHVGGELIGSLNVESTQLAAFTKSMIEILREVTGPLAVAIQQAGLYAQIQYHAEELERRVADRTRELSALYTVTSVAIESLDIQVTLERSLRAVLESTASHAGAIQLLDETRTHLQLSSEHNLSAHLVAELGHMSADMELAAQVVQSGEPVLVSDAQSSTRLPRPFLMLASPPTLGCQSVLVEISPAS